MHSPPTAGVETGRRPRLRTSQAADYCAVSASLLNKLPMTGAGSQFTKISNIVVYDQDDLDAWLDAHRCVSTSGDAA